MAEQAQEMVTDATPEKKAFMAKRSTHEDRIKKDEEELQQLLKEQTGDEEQEENKDSIEEKEYQKRLKDLESQLDNAAKKEMKLPKSDEDLEAWAKEYPDVAKIVETIAMKKAREQSEQLEKKIKQIDEMNMSAVKERAEVELLKLHPDFDEIRDSDDFHEWAEQQPKWIQDALYENENDARAAGRAIDLYKADRNIGKKDTSKDDKSAAKAINTKSKKTEVDVTETSKKIRESDVQRMSADQYEKNADMIMEAIRSGNFLYDISGSAR